MSGLLSGLLAPILNTSLQQSFRAVQVPNTQLALYTLSIRFPGRAAAPFKVYTFPVSPQAIRKTFTSMSTIYDVPGTPLYNGVQREVDVYGLSPVTYTVEGTTGWQRHSNDGYLFTGLQSVQAIQALLSEYALLNQVQMQNQLTNLYTLEFYDYFNREFWQIEPIGPQGITQDASQPLYTKYRFTWAGINRVDAPIFSSLSDPLGQLFSAVAGPVISTVQSSISSVLSSYGL